MGLTFERLLFRFRTMVVGFVDPRFHREDFIKIMDEIMKVA